MRLSGGLVLRTHMRMNGSWHIYRPGERGSMPRHAMRILIETADWVAVAFNVYVAEFVRGDALGRHRPVATLGPDLLGDFDRNERSRAFAPRAARPTARRAARSTRDGRHRQRLQVGDSVPVELHPDTPGGRVGDAAWTG